MNSERRMAQSVILRPHKTGDNSLSQRFGDGLKIRGRNGATYDLLASISASKHNVSTAEGLHWPAAPKSAWLDPQRVELFDAPFSFLVGDSPFDTQSAQAIHDWLEHIDKWKLNEGEFYSSFECNLLNLEAPQDCKHLFSPSAHDAFSIQASSVFGTPVVLSTVLAAHRMTFNQGVGIHSDSPRPGEETHRMVYTFSRNPVPHAGGHFLFLSGNSPQTATHLIPLHNNQVIAFRLSSTSYHAVTTITTGDRYSIVASFYSAEP